MSGQRDQPGSPAGQGQPPPRHGAPSAPNNLPTDLSGSGELVLTEEIAAAPPARPSGRGWRVDEAGDEAADAAGLSDHARIEEEPAAEAPEPPGPDVGLLLEASPDHSSDATIDVAGSGEGPLLLDASPDDEEGIARPVKPAPRPPTPVQPLARPPTPGSPLSRSTPANPLQRPGGPGSGSGRIGSGTGSLLSRSTPSLPLPVPVEVGPGGKITRRLGEFYGGAADTPRRPSSRRFEPVCRVCGSRLDGARCARCGEPGTPAAGAAAAAAAQIDPLARSTPRGALATVPPRPGAEGHALARDRLARESEQRAALAVAVEGARRRGDRTVILASAGLLALLGAPVSALAGPAWLVGLFLPLDGALGAWAGSRIARSDVALGGQVAAGGAMGAGVAAKLLVAALHTDAHLVLALVAALGACLVAALLGGVLAKRVARSGSPQA